MMWLWVWLALNVGILLGFIIQAVVRDHLG